MLFGHLLRLNQCRIDFGEIAHNEGVSILDGGCELLRILMGLGLIPNFMPFFKGF